MPRKHGRKIGSRPYRNYTDPTIEEALDEIKRNKISIRKAAEKYGIHRNTLWLKLKGKHEGTPGHPTVFYETEEQAFVSHCVSMSNYGFPLTGFDVRCIVKSYLDQVGRTVTCFKNNFPGIDWQNSFMARHRILTVRFAQNISTARAAVDEEVINNFFDHLEREIEGVPGSNIWSYETNLVDDPGSSKIITKRGTKYPERIRNSTKACTSIMFCGNAEGRLAPIYVNYKSKHLWSTWAEGGPAGARYNCTSSGWFDYNSFEDFFVNTMLPILRRQDGPKILIGDNLSSHLNIEVICKCEENNIRFISLPPNATHLLQPLDVAFFRPLKRNWKIILTEWKESPAGLRTATIPKQEFPTLLKKLVEKVEENQGKNLISGFRKAGIYPLNREEVLNRLCGRIQEKENESTYSNVSASFIEHLIQQRTELTEKRQTKNRRINVTPGKSISAMDLQGPSGVNNPATPEMDLQGPSGVNNPATPESSTVSVKKSSLQKKQPSETSDESNAESVVYAESNDSWNETDSESDGNVIPAFREEDKTVGGYVVLYEGKYYPGMITKCSKEGTLVNVMELSGKHWRWPEERDEILYQDKEIVCKISAPKKKGKRNIYDVPEMNQLPA